MVSTGGGNPAPWQNLSVLVVGAGSIGRRHSRVLRELGVRDLRVCDPAPEQRQRLAAEIPGVGTYAGFEEGLEARPDAVFICTPPEMHVPMVSQALRAGCHVFCEKPLSDSPCGLAELSAQAGASGLQAMVGLCFRFHEGLRRARQALDTGQLGRVISIRALMGEHLPEVRPDYRQLFSAQGIGVFDLMHEIDLAVWFAGRPVAGVKCYSGGFSDIGIAGPDLAEILIRFGGGCLASIHLDFFQRPRRRQFEIIGTEGVAVVEFARWDRCSVAIYRVAGGLWQQEDLVTDRDDMFRAEDREFLGAIATGSPISCPIDEGRRSIEVVAAAQADAADTVAQES